MSCTQEAAQKCGKKRISRADSVRDGDPAGRYPSPAIGPQQSGAAFSSRDADKRCFKLRSEGAGVGFFLPRRLRRIDPTRRFGGIKFEYVGRRSELAHESKVVVRRA